MCIAFRQLGIGNANGGKSMEKLSSGFRINRAGDDAAGLSISEKMRGQIRGLNMASRNSQDGISMIQTAEGALTETHAILQRMRELAVQAANDTNVGDDRTEIQNELNQLIEEIDRIGNTTEFNTQKLLDGGATQAAGDNNDAVALTAVVNGGVIDGAGDLNGFDFSGVGNDKTFDVNGVTVTLNTDLSDIDGMITEINTQLEAGNAGVVVTKNDAGDGLVLTSSADIELAGGDLGDFGLTAGTTEAVAAEGEEGAVTGIDVSTHEKASAAIDTIDSAIKLVSAQRSKLGAWQNRLEHTIKNLDTSSENLQAAESRIRDVDMAKEMMEFTKNNILQQAAQAMLAQANQQPQGVLQLLR